MSRVCYGALPGPPATFTIPLPRRSRPDDQPAGAVVGDNDLVGVLQVGREAAAFVGQSAISTAADASRTTAGTAGSDLAQLARLGQVVSDPLSEPPGRRAANSLHPGLRV